ncbi:hypothetical protein QX776_02220 [Alteromonadaceae bacterium BrNp21-10]|nr:hypothetical protein [Alteromonadaceae bacterium BrNp21-10]
MIKELQDALHKRCLVGLSYFDVNGEMVKQSLLGGTVASVDVENGIALVMEDENKTQFIIPANLSCWFSAPKGEFHTSQEGVKMVNPEYLVTWDIHQTKGEKQEGEQQWWEWVPRTETPRVNQ